MALRQRKNKTPKKTLKSRFEEMSPEESAQRWRDMRPRYFKWLGMFSLLAALIWLGNHALLMTHSMDDLKANYETVVHILNAGFQISSIFCCLFIALTGMSYMFGRPAKARASV